MDLSLYEFAQNNGIRVYLCARCSLFGSLRIFVYHSLISVYTGVTFALCFSCYFFFSCVCSYCYCCLLCVLYIYLRFVLLRLKGGLFYIIYVWRYIELHHQLDYLTVLFVIFRIPLVSVLVIVESRLNAQIHKGRKCKTYSTHSLTHSLCFFTTATAKHTRIYTQTHTHSIYEANTKLRGKHEAAGERKADEIH